METAYQSESNWPEWISLAHLEFIVDFVECERAKEEAVIARFLSVSRGCEPRN
jgi:hypothetical protein